MGGELKACPFCGVVNTHMASGWLDGRYNEEEWFQVECQECCAAGPSKPFEYEAAEAWNNAGAGAATARAEAAEQRAAAAEGQVERMLTAARKIVERSVRDAENARKRRLEWSESAGCEAAALTAMLRSLERAAQAKAKPDALGGDQ